MLGVGLGVLAVQQGILSGGGEPGVPAWVPTGAIGFADFRTGANGNYWDGTAAVTADEMFDDDANYGVTFDSSTLTASGLPGAGDGSVGGYVVGLLGEAMLSGCIIVAQFSIAFDTALGSGLYFEAYDDPGFNTDWAFQASDQQVGVRDYTGGDGWHFTDDATDGTNKFSVEFNPDLALTCSINGAAAVSTSCTVSPGTPMTNLMFQVNKADPSTCYLETLAVYPVGYAALNALSA
jgi:hypothetical protein